MKDRLDQFFSQESSTERIEILFQICRLENDVMFCFRAFIKKGQLVNMIIIQKWSQ